MTRRQFLQALGGAFVVGTAGVYVPKRTYFFGPWFPDPVFMLTGCSYQSYGVFDLGSVERGREFRTQYGAWPVLLDSKEETERYLNANRMAVERFGANSDHFKFENDPKRPWILGRDGGQVVVMVKKAPDLTPQYGPTMYRAADYQRG